VSKTKSKLVEVVEKALRLAKLIGVTNTIKDLEELERNHYSQPTIHKSTLDKVCNKFHISKKEFKNGNSKINKKRYNARAVYTFIMIDVMGLQPKEVRDYLSCSISAITGYRNYIKCLNPEISVDKEVYDICKEIEVEINDNFIKK